MHVFDMILNLAGLLIWLNWRSAPWAFRAIPAHATFHSAEGHKRRPFLRRFYCFMGLLLLLLLRPLFYWQVGSSINWLPTLHLVAIHLPFRSDYLSRMYGFSFLSFGQVVAVFYLCLLLLSAVSRTLPDTNYLQSWMRRHLGWLDRMPNLLKWAAPFLVGFTFWLISGPLFIQAGMLAELRSPTHLLQQASLIGVSAYLSWKPFLVVWLLLNILNSYVFLGNFAFWNFLNSTAQNLLHPLARLPLQLGKADFRPAVAILLVVFLSELLTRSVISLYPKLPL